MEEARRADEDGEIPGTMLSVPERAEVLQDYLAEVAGRGWRVEGKGNFIAFMVSGKPVNHLLHAAVSLLTGGLWLPVWAWLVVFRGEKRMLARVDRYGEVRTYKQ